MSVIGRIYKVGVTILCLGILMCLFPPWLETFQMAGAPRTVRAVGYAPIWAPPEFGSDVRRGVQVDTGRMALQLVALASILGIAVLLAYRPRKPKDGDDTYERVDGMISRQVVKLWTIATHQEGYEKEAWMELQALLSKRGIVWYGGSGESRPPHVTQ